MNQTQRRQLSSRDRWLALLGVIGVVMVLVLLYQPTGPRERFRDLSEQNPLPNSFSRLLVPESSPAGEELGSSNANAGSTNPEAVTERDRSFEPESVKDERSDWAERLALYQAGRFDEFILAASAEPSEPGPRELLYLGSAQLLAGRLTDAIQSLRRVLPARDSLVVAEARWQLSQAYLAAEEPGPARDELIYLTDRKAHRAWEAKQKLAVLESRQPFR